jgi:hypothetical protein
VTVSIAEGVVVAGDRMRLRQIVDNLLSNVRTHTPAGTEVRVSVGNGGSLAVLTVADRGPGIAPEDRSESSSASGGLIPRGPAAAAGPASASRSWPRWCTPTTAR